jgi:hypothetical protein
MELLMFVACLLAQAPDQPPAAESRIEAIRAAYREDAEKYVFHADAERKHELKMVQQPIMRWFNDNDWHGDVFLWTGPGESTGRPAVIGCILSGPTDNSERRNVYHEFHLLAERPIAAAQLHTNRRWAPEVGLQTAAVTGGPTPAATPTSRLVQMRQIAREFTAHLEADGTWELRLLTQPLYRYGDAESEVIDGALFTYVWTRGTDPELVLLLECRRTDDGAAWHYAPVRLSNKLLWLKHHGKEVWRSEGHREPPGNATTLPYTTAWSRSLFATPSDAESQP